MSNIITVDGVSKVFTGHKALDNISLEIPEGKIYGLLGPNGAGKTTLIRIINHITAPDSGTVLFDGHPLTADDIVNIGYLPEERGLYKKMRVGDQAVFFARLKGLSKKDAVTKLKEWFEKFQIMDWWNKKVEELSKGMAQKVQFIVTVLHEPRLLIFDEPFSGFDPINADLLKKEILGLRDKGATVIFSTHNMSSVEMLCDNITLINKSRNILTGNVAEIRERMGANRYKFVFAGSIAPISDIMPRIATDHDIAVDVSNQKHELIVSLRNDVTLHDVVSLLNDSVDLRSFEPALSSMDDIFIKTVNMYNAEHTTRQ